MRIMKLVVLALALLVTHGRATAALSHRSEPRPQVHLLASLHPGGWNPAAEHHASVPAPVEPSPGARGTTRIPGGWGLLLAGVVGAWAIARRRLASIGSGWRR